MLSGLRSLEESIGEEEKEGRRRDEPMHDVVLMKEGKGRGYLCDVKSDGIFLEGA